MASSETIPARKLDVLGADFVEGRDEMTRLFQEQVRHDIAEHLAAGRPVYYGGDWSRGRQAICARAGRPALRIPRP